MNILVDVDETLTDFLKKRNKLIKKYIDDNKLPYKIIDKNSVHSVKVADWPIEECLKFWNKVGAIAQLECPCQKDCQTVLKKLKNKGHKIIIVSGRLDMFFPALKHTKLWLDKNDIPYDDIIVGKEDKTQPMIDNDIQLVIDDSEQTIACASKLGIESLMFLSKNINGVNVPKTCVKVMSWKEIEEVLIDKKIL